MTTDTQPAAPESAPPAISVRPATAVDIPSLVLIGAARYRESGWRSLVGFRCLDADASLRRFIDDPNAIALVAETAGEVTGFSLSVFGPSWLCTVEATCLELVRWAVPQRSADTGRALLAALEVAATQRGAAVLKLTSSVGLGDHEAEEASYREAGYRPAERTYLRNLALAGGPV